MIEGARSAGDETAVVAKLGTKIFGAMAKCLGGDSNKGREDCKKLLKLDPHHFYKIVLQYCDILVFHSDKLSAGRKFATYLPKEELTFKSRFS